MNQQQVQQEALANARNNESMANYAAIFEGFEEKGIPADQIEPRINVFTFNAWKALGRSVRKGEHGVKVCTWVPMTKKNDDGESKSIGRKPRMTTVFHVSQTEGFESDSAADTGAHAEVEQQKIDPIYVNRTDVNNEPSDYYSDEFTPIN